MPANYLNTLHTWTAKTFYRAWSNPQRVHAAKDLDVRVYRYDLLWDLYEGNAFSDMEAWARYRRAFSLYRQIRQVWDHCHQLVEFYVGHVWSGSLSYSGQKLPDGVPNAIPMAEDTPDDLLAAIGQLWQWWGFQETMSLIPRYTAALGELMVELRDDPARGKVMIELIWPGHVKDLVLDEVGNVKSYTIQYEVKPVGGDPYTYTRKVDGDSFRTLKDGKPFDYTKDPIPVGTEPYGTVGTSGLLDEEEAEDGSVIENPYGFAPAAWFRHHRMMGVRGEPAIYGTMAQLDEVNQLFSHILDKTHVSLNAPIIVSGNIAPNALQRALTQMVGAVKGPFTEEQDEPTSQRESLNIIEGPAGTDVKTIDIKISEAVEALDRIIAAIEKKCPEITFYQELRSMTQLTGPGASNLLGDVDRKVRAIAAGYDYQLTKLHQMATSICAFRLAEGKEGWATPDAQQRKFGSFNVDSYANGDLDHTIIPRDIVRTTTRDRYEVLQLKKNVLGTFIPPSQLAKEGGYAPDVVEKWEAEAETRAQEFAQQQPPAPVDSPRPVGAPPGGPQRGQPQQNRRPIPDIASRRVG